MSLNLSKTIDTVGWSSIAFPTSDTIVSDAYKGPFINKIFTKDTTTIISLLQMEKMR